MKAATWRHIVRRASGRHLPRITRSRIALIYTAPRDLRHCRSRFVGAAAFRPQADPLASRGGLHQGNEEMLLAGRAFVERRKTWHGKVERSGCVAGFRCMRPSTTTFQRRVEEIVGRIQRPPLPASTGTPVRFSTRRIPYESGGLCSARPMFAGSPPARRPQPGGQEYVAGSRRGRDGVLVLLRKFTGASVETLQRGGARQPLLPLQT